MKRAILGFGLVFIIALSAWHMSKSQMGFGFAFSVDIGSDRELSDPNPDGMEGFDPGDAYRTDAPAGSIAGSASSGGTDGTHRDDEDLLGIDQPPDAGTSTVTVVPVGACPVSCYDQYFDLDGYDVVNLQLQRLAADGLTPPYAQADLDAAYGSMGWLNCIEEVAYLAVSFDDDAALGWAAPRPERVPVESASSHGRTYGSSSAQDEIVGITLVPGTGRPREIDKVFGLGSEEDVHADLMPNPDTDQQYDDDVDALDMIYPDQPCDVYLYSADREAALGPAGAVLRPGAIYQEGMATPIIQPVSDLGLPPGVDIDAFELAWLPKLNGDLALGILFSVDEDDPRTPSRDESGGLYPGTIYGSLLNGRYFEVVNPLLESRMYCANEHGAGTFDLISIDRSMGTATVIGSISISHTGNVHGLDFDPDGTLYGATQTHILKFDIAPPCAVVEIPMSTSLTEVTGLAFRSDGRLYLITTAMGTSTLYQADVTTGAVTLVGDITRGSTTSFYINGMDFGPDGRLWLLHTYSDEVSEADPATGAIINSYAVPYPAGRDSDDFAMAIDATGRMFITNEYLLEITGYSTGTPSVTVIGPTGYSTLHNLADNSVFLDDIDAITVSHDDLYVPEYNQPIIFERE